MTNPDRNREIYHQALATPAQVPVEIVHKPYSAENPFHPLTTEQAATIQASMVHDNVSRNLLRSVVSLEDERDVLENQRDFDTLTGAGSLFAARNEIQKLIVAGADIDLYFLDFNNFKQVNDQLGHDAGDSTLIALTSALIGKLRFGETIYRVGGDEFVIVKNRSVQADRRHEDVDIAAAQNHRNSTDRRAEKEDDTEGLRSRIAGALEQSLTILNEIMGEELSSKMGISVGHARRVPGQSLDDLWRAADLAMYEDKRLNKLEEVKGLTPDAYYLPRLKRIREYLRGIRATRESSPDEEA